MWSSVAQSGPWISLAVWSAIGAGCARGEVPVSTATSPAIPAVEAKAGAEKKVSDPNKIQSSVAQLLGKSADTIAVEIDDEVSVGGLTFFRYELDGGGERGAYGSGVDDGQVTTVGFAKSGPRVAKALGGNRDAVAMAQAFGVLETELETATVLLTQSQVDDLPENWRSHVSTPKVEAAGDGYVLTYWCEAGEPPLFMSRITVRGATVERERRDIWSFVD
ncbi:MAG TPA: hypothetical protein PK095_15965 [Myxococcota bacterium]|nr:hypothetical protein [Myxococcota bacterium]